MGSGGVGAPSDAPRAAGRGRADRERSAFGSEESVAGVDLGFEAGRFGGDDRFAFPSEPSEDFARFLGAAMSWFTSGRDGDRPFEWGGRAELRSSKLGLWPPGMGVGRNGFAEFDFGPQPAAGSLG